MTRDTNNSPKTVTRIPSTNSGPPTYDHGKPPTITATGKPAVKAGLLAPDGDRIPRDMRKNAHGN